MLVGPSVARYGRSLELKFVHNLAADWPIGNGENGILEGFSD